MSIMPLKQAYTRYLPPTAGPIVWGLQVNAAGYAVIPPNTRYPQVEFHPKDHWFDWTRGRTLDCLQVVFIPAGSGWLETSTQGIRRVRAGMAFMLLPGEWHRYRPDAATGWVESWVELTGPVMSTLLQAGVFRADKPLLRGALDAGLAEAMDELHRHLFRGLAATAPELSALGLRVLAACAKASEPRSRPVALMAQKIAKAEQELRVRFAEPVNMEQLARRLGIAYSHFRREFQVRTGLAPWRYVSYLRMQHARRLLTNRDLKLDTVAEAVGFASGSQFSHAFKRAYGQSPAHWRAALDAGS
jgi:AraC-like DNA-binding protein